MTEAQREEARRLIQQQFLANEKGWREWYAMTNDGKTVDPPNGMAERLMQAIASAIAAAERRVWEEAFLLMKNANDFDEAFTAIRQRAKGGT